MSRTIESLTKLMRDDTTMRGNFCNGSHLLSALCDWPSLPRLSRWTFVQGTCLGSTAVDDTMMLGMWRECVPDLFRLRKVLIPRSFMMRSLTKGFVRPGEAVSFLCEGVPSLKPRSSLETIISHHGNDLPLTHIQSMPRIPFSI